MPFVRSLKFVFMNLLLPGDLGTDFGLWLCPWSTISSSDPESERWGPISLDAASYFARLSLFVGVGFFDSGELSSPLSYLLLVTLLRTPAKTQDIDGAPVLWSAPRSVGNFNTLRFSCSTPTETRAYGHFSQGGFPTRAFRGSVQIQRIQRMWRRLLSHTEVWEDRECTVLTTEASAGRWLRPVHETDDFSSYANPVVEVELLEDSCRGWVNIANNIQLSARETEDARPSREPQIPRPSRSVIHPERRRVRDEPRGANPPRPGYVQTGRNHRPVILRRPGLHPISLRQLNRQARVHPAAHAPAAPLRRARG
jgi:hypothetical protein